MKKWLAVMVMLLVLFAAAAAESVVTTPENVQAGKPFTVQWSPVEGAASYDVTIIRDGSSVTGDNVKEASYTYTRYDLPQGAYQLKITAFDANRTMMQSSVVDFSVGAPEIGNEFFYIVEQKWNGSEYAVSGVAAVKYLGAESEVVIPEQIDAAILAEQYAGDTRYTIPEGMLPVIRLGSAFIDSRTETMSVTIPRTVTQIGNGAFDNVAELTIYGDTGTVAEQYAVLNGCNFICLDDGEGDFAVTWDGDIKVGSETVFTLKGVNNVSWIWARLNGQDITITKKKESGKNMKIQPVFEKAGVYYLQVEVSLKDNSRLYSKMIPVEVLADGQMITVGNIQVDRPVIERGSTVRVKFVMPDGHTEFMYGLTEPAYEGWGWHPITLDTTSGYGAISGTKNVTYRMDGNYFVEPGYYVVHIGLPTVDGLEQTEAFVEIEVISTRPFGYFEYREEIFDYVANDLNMVVPAQIDGMPVKKIADEAFSGLKIETAVLEEGIEAIGSEVFRNCRQLTSVTLPSTLTQIGDAAFEECVKLERVVLPDNLKSLPSALFNNCKGLKEVVMPMNLQRLNATNKGYYTMPFTGCESLERVVFPNGDLIMQAGCLPSNVTIVAPVGSTAHEYATECGNPFEALEN